MQKEEQTANGLEAHTGLHSVDEAPPSPYSLYADTLRAAFIGRAVSDFETEVNEPRFMALLPNSPKIRRILDIGCGPAFPDYLRRKYPNAEILGVDAAPEMLPEPRPDDSKARFTSWQGPGLRRDEARRFIEENGGRFDLITLKMSAHYLDLYDLLEDIGAFLAPNGYVAISIPHPEDSAQLVPAPRTRTTYRRRIGRTGIEATMIHRPARDLYWQALTFHSRPDDSYRKVFDEPTDVEGNKKRLNILLRPPTVPEKIGDMLLSLVNEDGKLRRVHRFKPQPKG